MSDRIPVRSRDGTYEVVFSQDPASILREMAEPDAFTIADPTVIDVLEGVCEGPLSRERLFLLEATEERKTMDQVQILVNWLVESQARRGCRLVALGGGVIQDVTAFTASILYRGIDWVFVPTTLLAQADSCIGGKTPINVSGNKNVVGNFYPPIRILNWSGFLESLPELEVKSGIGEIFHFFVYADSPLTERLAADYDPILEDRALLRPYIAESLRIKKSVIEEDEFDRGERNKFNYGHTFGHALEALTRFELTHGQAVTTGMCLANSLSRFLGLCEVHQAEALNSLLSVNLPEYHWADLSITEFMDALSKDKKNVDNESVTCILLEKPGHLRKEAVLLDATLYNFLEQFFEGELPDLAARGRTRDGTERLDRGS